MKKATVLLGVGLPIGRLAKEKDAFRRYLSEPKEVRFHFSGKAYIVTISDVIVFPQCYGAVAHRIPQMKSEEVIVDIGSWTIDTLKIVNHHPELNEDQKKMLQLLMEEQTSIYGGGSDIGQNVVQLGMTKLGCHYSQARRYDEGYYDCSSFVMRMYREF